MTGPFQSISFLPEDARAREFARLAEIEKLAQLKTRKEMAADRIERKRMGGVAAKVTAEYLSGVLRVDLAAKYKIPQSVVGKIVNDGVSALQQCDVEARHHARRSREWLRKKNGTVKYRDPSIAVNINGTTYSSITAAALAVGVSPSAAHKYRKLGIPPEQWADANKNKGGRPPKE